MADPVVNLPGEKWKPIVGYEGLYEVSNMGRVKSLRRRCVERHSRGGVKVVIRCERIRKQGRGNGKGLYRAIALRDAAGVTTTQLVHRLVASAFIGVIPAGYAVCHNDGDSTNNRAGNLRIATYKDNEADKLKHGTHERGERNHAAKLTTEDVLAIRASADPVKIVAARYGISLVHAYDIRAKRKWSHL